MTQGLRWPTREELREVVARWIVEYAREERQAECKARAAQIVAGAMA